MSSSESLEAFEDHWKEFLRRLERSWSKAEAQFGSNERWSGWQGRFSRARKKDPLLSYLRHARNADEHTIAPITERKESQLLIRAAGPEGRSHIKRIRIGEDGMLMIEADGSLELSFQPYQSFLLPVVNRGNSFPVPTRHLDSAIDPTNVLSIAKAGLEYYSNFLAEAEVFFG